ncbi:MAG: 3-isopropylmalate dehydrogenase, partial [Firmicutes bacterium]|nr:3-isopropylmalate dehydrogenase [Bacillota bacterium]
MHNLLVLPGDGIGPEVTEQAVRVLRRVGEVFQQDFVFREALIGGAALDAQGVPLPEDTLQLARESDAVLFGAIGGPRWNSLPAGRSPEQGLLALRQGMGVFANLRPARLYPELRGASALKTEILEKGVDLIIVRELTGGLYFGQPRGRTKLPDGQERALDTMVYSSGEIQRVARVAFRLAQNRRQRLLSVDKANVLESSRLWREVVTEVARDFPQVHLSHMYVDNCAMQK